jgi:hypothetical protein
MFNYNIPAQLGGFSSEHRNLFLLDNRTPTFANFIFFKTNFFIQNVRQQNKLILQFSLKVLKIK